MLIVHIFHGSMEKFLLQNPAILPEKWAAHALKKGITKPVFHTPPNQMAGSFKKQNYTNASIFSIIEVGKWNIKAIPLLPETTEHVWPRYRA
jgi:hypothetical protein